MGFAEPGPLLLSPRQRSVGKIHRKIDLLHSQQHRQQSEDSPPAKNRAIDAPLPLLVAEVLGELPQLAFFRRDYLLLQSLRRPLTATHQHFLSLCRPSLRGRFQNSTCFVIQKGKKLHSFRARIRQPNNILEFLPIVFDQYGSLSISGTFHSTLMEYKFEKSEDERELL